MTKKDRILQEIKKILRVNANYPVEHRKYKIFYDITKYLDDLRMNSTIYAYFFDVDDKFNVQMSIQSMPTVGFQIYVEDVISKRKSKLSQF
jgi:hypothetical protein